MRYLFLTLFLACFIYWPPGEAKAQQMCMPRNILENRLTDTFKESPFIAAITANGELMQIFYNSHSGTWTVTITKASGDVSCMVVTGDSFISMWVHPEPESET